MIDENPQLARRPGSEEAKLEEAEDELDLKGFLRYLAAALMAVFKR